MRIYHKWGIKRSFGSVLSFYIPRGEFNTMPFSNFKSTIIYRNYRYNKLIIYYEPKAKHSPLTLIGRKKNEWKNLCIYSIPMGIGSHPERMGMCLPSIKSGWVREEDHIVITPITAISQRSCA
jgi:hypothetical protein